jgi:hypothetical protein
MRLRTDSWMWADIKIGPQPITHEQAVKWYGEEEAKEYDNTPPPAQGDVWEIHWSKTEPANDGTNTNNVIEGIGPLAGYALVCPGCKRVHAWTTANNCARTVKFMWVDEHGKQNEGAVCVHSGKSSCWNWTGSAKDGTLTATPSLLNHECGWHGFLTNGVMKAV